MNLNPLLEWWGALVFVHCFPDCVGLRACIGCVSVTISLLKRCGENSVGWIQANPVIFDGEFDWFTGMIRSSCFGEMLFRSYKKNVCDQIMSWLPCCWSRGLVKRALAWWRQIQPFWVTQLNSFPYWWGALVLVECWSDPMKWCVWT